LRVRRSREDLVHEIVLLHTQGMKVRPIARALGVARKTIDRVLAEHAAGREAGALAIPRRHDHARARVS
jgi:transposase